MKKKANTLTFFTQFSFSKCTLFLNALPRINSTTKKDKLTLKPYKRYLSFGISSARKLKVAELLALGPKKYEASKRIAAALISSHRIPYKFFVFIK